MKEEYIKFMYDKVYDELNRCRDWPLKVLTITSALYLAMIGALKLNPDAFQALGNWTLVFRLSFILIGVFIVGIIICFTLNIVTHKSDFKT